MTDHLRRILKHEPSTKSNLVSSNATPIRLHASSKMTGSPVPLRSSGHVVNVISHGQITPSFGFELLQLLSVIKNGVKSTTQILCVHVPGAIPSLPSLALNLRSINLTAPGGAFAGRSSPEQSSKILTRTCRLTSQLSSAHPSNPQLCGCDT